MCKANPDINVGNDNMVRDFYNRIFHPALAILTLRVVGCGDGQTKAAAVSMDRLGKSSKTKPHHQEKNCNNPL